MMGEHIFGSFRRILARFEKGWGYSEISMNPGNDEIDDGVRLWRQSARLGCVYNSNEETYTLYTCLPYRVLRSSLRSI